MVRLVAFSYQEQWFYSMLKKITFNNAIQQRWATLPLDSLVYRFLAFASQVVCQKPPSQSAAERSVTCN